MHFFNGVVIDPRDETGEAVDRAMAPHREEWHGDDETGDYVGFWDWYQVGGRWTGVWSDYDPRTDPANQQPCRLCDATGQRTDSVALAHAGGPMKCNGCDGTGTETLWPTQWKSCDDDRVPVSRILDDPKAEIPYRLVLPDSGIIERERWTGDDFVETPDWERVARKALEPYRNAHIVVVDNHS